MFQNYTINYFLEFVDPEKLVMGIPTFGRTYKLVDPQETALGSDSDGAGDKGPITGEKGFFAYFEVISMLSLLLYCLQIKLCNPIEFILYLPF